MEYLHGEGVISYWAKPKKKKNFWTVSREKEMPKGNIHPWWIHVNLWHNQYDIVNYRKKKFVKILVSSNFCFLRCDTADP